MSLNESIVEDATLAWFGELGYAVGHGPHLAPGEPAAERASFDEVVLAERLRAALRRLNGIIPADAREEALRKVLRVGTPSLTQTNRAFHKMLRDGVDVEYPRGDGTIKGDEVVLVDFSDNELEESSVVKQCLTTATVGILPFRQDAWDGSRQFSRQSAVSDVVPNQAVPTVSRQKCRDTRATRRGETESRQTSRHLQGG